MKNPIKPQRISQQDIGTVAAQGVQRALEAREACMRELSDAEVAEVSGGASLILAKAIIAGGPILRDLLNTNLATPTLDAGMMGSLATLG